MLRHIYTYFTSSEFDALWRAASMRQNERTDLMENSTRLRPEDEEADEAIAEEVHFFN